MINISETTAQLRQIELDHADNKDHTTESGVDASTGTNDHDSSCYNRFTLWISTVIPLQTIINCISTALTNSYDLITILISIADVSTDIWVIYNFKQSNRNTFFIIALIILILAQVSYAVAFMVRFRVKYYGKDTIYRIKKRILLFLVILPLTPVISFIFYWCTTYPNNCFMTFLEKYFDVSDDVGGYTVNENQASMLVWIEKKVNKHIGFIIEAMVEALPQSIIQLIAIVYFQDTQLINVISICISLLSVATKTMVFSIAIDFRVFIYNWLSLVCDFFGVFAIVSWYVKFK